MPTILEAFGCSAPGSVRGMSLMPALRDPGAPGHEAVIYGYFGGAVNVTDGQHTYFRYPADLLDQELYQYTLMPSHMLVPFGRTELQGAELVTDLAFADGYPVLRIQVVPQSPWYQSHGPAVMEPNGSLLFDVQADPAQQMPLDDAEQQARLSQMMCKVMQRNDAPPEAFARLGLVAQEV